MIFWSFSFIWTSVAILSFPPITLITLRLMIASALLFAIVKLCGTFQIIQRKDLKLFLMLAFFEPFLYYLGETFGLTMVSSTLASVIISTIPLFSPILAFVLLRERIGWFTMIGIIVSLMGVLCVIYVPNSGFTANPWGVALLFLAVFAAICYITTLRRISTEYSTLNVIFYQSFFGLIFFVPTFFLTEFSKIATIHITSQAITALLLLSLFASVVAFVLFAGAVRRVGVARTNVFVNLIPVFTAIFSWLLLDEIIRFTQWLGIVVVVMGLFVSQWDKISFRKVN
jgi:drug/metabolite transporter (DMT)-like permease